MEQSDLLTQFYRAYTAWIDDGAPQGIIFTRGHGLCTNLADWGSAIDLALYDKLHLREEMRQQFHLAKLDKLYPFDSGPRSYIHTAMEASCYLNEDRIKWARDHAE